MDPVAIEHAKDRLEVAEEALAKLHEATVQESFKAIRREWSNFLLAASAIYSKLEQGSKSNGKSYGWFSRKKKERKDDELLSYIHHARNTDHHGLSPVIRKGEQVEVTFPVDAGNGQPVSLLFTMGEGTTAEEARNFKTEMTDNQTGEVFKPLTLKARTYLSVVQVKDDKHGDKFDPPTRHRGEAIEVDEPLGIATLAVEYLRELIADAENYVVP